MAAFVGRLALHDTLFAPEKDGATATRSVPPAGLRLLVITGEASRRPNGGAGVTMCAVATLTRLYVRHDDPRRVVDACASVMTGQGTTVIVEAPTAYRPLPHVPGPLRVIVAPLDTSWVSVHHNRSGLLGAHAERISERLGTRVVDVALQTTAEYHAVGVYESGRVRRRLEWVADGGWLARAGTPLPGEPDPTDGFDVLEYCAEVFGHAHAAKTRPWCSGRP